MGYFFRWPVLLVSSVLYKWVLLLLLKISNRSKIRNREKKIEQLICKTNKESISTQISINIENNKNSKISPQNIQLTHTISSYFLASLLPQIQQSVYKPAAYSSTQRIIWTGIDG
jgi:predicted transcriptional regulator